ncbi:MAG: PAS domain S-box protein [Proteobacteria bacterium]|nr:PAS domain S-box protein [Pseudomonadota bacterium]
MESPRDIEDAGSESTARLEALLATAVDGIIITDALGHVQVYNLACERLFGYPARDIIGKNVKMLMPSPYHEEHDRYIDSYRATGQAKIIGIGREVVGRRKDGSTFPMYLSVGEGRLNDASIFVGVIHDITDRRHAEETRDRLAAIVESSHDAVIGKDLNGIVTTWNFGAQSLYGYAAAEMVGKPLALLAPPDRQNEISELIAKVRQGRTVSHYDNVRVTKDGRQLDVSLTLSPIRDAAGALVGVSTIARDVTELRRAELRVRELTQEMVHISRLSAMGQLASSLAHELNQPLTAIINYTEAVRHTLANLPTPPPPRIAELLEKAAGQAERAGQIIRRLRGFVEKGEVERSTEQLGAVVEEASALATVGARVDGIRVIIDLAEDLPPIRIDKIQIQQVVVNLVRNAIEALHDAKRRELIIRTAPAEDGYQEVAVIDTGPGLAPAIAEQLFKPFVTTKKTGMGIGLSISQSIITGHGGRIWAEANPNGGTTFRFWLPIC